MYVCMFPENGMNEDLVGIAACFPSALHLTADTLSSMGEPFLPAQPLCYSNAVSSVCCQSFQQGVWSSDVCYQAVTLVYKYHGPVLWCHVWWCGVLSCIPSLLQHQDLRPVPTDRSFCILNPQGNLSRTEQTFAPWLKKHRWKGLIGKPPSKEQLVSAVTENDLFVWARGLGGTDVYIHPSIHPPIHPSIHPSIYPYICTSMHTYILVHTCMYKYTYVCVWDINIISVAVVPMYKPSKLFTITWSPI